MRAFDTLNAVFSGHSTNGNLFQIKHFPSTYSSVEVLIRYGWSPGLHRSCCLQVDLPKTCGARMRRTAFVRARWDPARNNMPKEQAKCATCLLHAGERKRASIACMCVRQSRLRSVADTGARPVHRHGIVISSGDKTGFTVVGGNGLLDMCAFTSAVHKTQPRWDTCRADKQSAPQALLAWVSTREPASQSTWSVR